MAQKEKPYGTETTWLAHCFPALNVAMDHLPGALVAATFVAWTAGLKEGEATDYGMSWLQRRCMHIPAGLTRMLSQGLGTLSNGIYAINVRDICTACKPYWDTVVAGTPTSSADTQPERPSNKSPFQPVLSVSSFRVVAHPGGQRKFCNRYLIGMRHYAAGGGPLPTQVDVQSLMRAARDNPAERLTSMMDSYRVDHYLDDPSPPLAAIFGEPHEQ